MTRTTSAPPAFGTPHSPAEGGSRAPERGPANKRAPWRTLLLTVHVAATVSLLGADLALLALGISGARGADPQTVYPAARLVGTWLAAPLALTSLATGLLQGVLTPWGWRGIGG